MVHQSSLCYKDLTLRHFVVSSTSVRRARVINWKIVCIVLCWDQCVQIYTEQIAFANGINLCFHLKNSPTESYRLFREAYGKDAPSQDTCGRWFRHFKSGDFDTRQKGKQGT